MQQSVRVAQSHVTAEDTQVGIRASGWVLTENYRADGSVPTVDDRIEWIQIGSVSGHTANTHAAQHEHAYVFNVGYMNGDCSEHILRCRHHSMGPDSDGDEVLNYGQRYGGEHADSGTSTGGTHAQSRWPTRWSVVDCQQATSGKY